MLKRLFCHHDSLTLVRSTEWFPTFRTTNGLDNEDERTLVLKCDECGKRIERTQVMSHGSIMNYREFL